MFDTLHTTRTTLESFAREFEPDALSGEDAVRVLTVLAVINRLTEGLPAQAAKRVADTAAHVAAGDCDAAQFYARVVGVGASDAHRVLATAKKLEALPVTAARCARAVVGSAGAVGCKCGDVQSEG